MPCRYSKSSGLALTPPCPYGIWQIMDGHATKTPARYIREDVFKCATQQEFADLLGFEQATISRWESGERRMNRTAQEKIRAAAKARGLRWDNNWFFEVPIKRPRNGRVPAVVSQPRAA